MQFHQEDIDLGLEVGVGGFSGSGSDVVSKLIVKEGIGTIKIH